MPGYSAVLFRRTFPELEQPGGLIPRSLEWLSNTDAKWNDTKHTWRFPSGAVLKFASMDSEKDKYKYQGGEYIRAGFDEVTQFSETQYQWINSRARRCTGFPWAPQLRCAANPGGVGHLWVKNRFINNDALDALRQGQGGVFMTDGRAFVPAKIDDNPHLQQEEYKEALRNLDPVTRARLMDGDWSVVQDALIKAEWLSYYDTQGQILRGLGKDGQRIEHGQIDERECRRFATVDTAGTTAQKEAERRGKPSSWSVMAVWDYWPRRKWLFLRHVWRKRVGFIDLCNGVEMTANDWNVPVTHIEDAHAGPMVHDTLNGRISTELLPTVTDYMKGNSGKPGKVERATPLFNKLDRGEIFLPAGNNDWVPDLEAEWLAWMGLKDEQADQIDVASYAATLCDDWREDNLGADAFYSAPQSR